MPVGISLNIVEYLFVHFSLALGQCCLTTHCSFEQNIQERHI